MSLIADSATKKYVTNWGTSTSYHVLYIVGSTLMIKRSPRDEIRIVGVDDLERRIKKRLRYQMTMHAKPMKPPIRIASKGDECQCGLMASICGGRLIRRLLPVRSEWKSVA